MLPVNLMNLVDDKRFGSKRYWRRKFNASIEMISAFKGRFPFRDSYVRGPFFTTMGLPDIWKDNRPPLEKVLILVRVARLFILNIMVAKDLENKEIDQETHDEIVAKIREQIKLQLGTDN